MRSSVENVYPCSLPSMRATVARTQSSFALESSPMPNAPSIDASSSRSESVRAAESFVCTWTAMSPLPLPMQRRSAARGLEPRFYSAAEPAPKGGRAALQHHGVVAEGDAQLADRAVDVDAEVVGEAQHLVAEVEQHRRVARVVAQDPLQALDAQLVQRRRRQSQGERRCRAGLEPLEHVDALADQVDARLVAAVETAAHGDDEVVGELVALLHQRAREQRHLDARLEVL